MNRVNLECSCGKLKGTLDIVSNKKSFRIQCYCSDCQNYAAHLGKEENILDSNGGSELFQTYPCHIKFTEGHENLACLQLKTSGLFRWHTSCCNSPIANTMGSAKVPFAGIFVNFMKFPSDKEKQKTLGPIVMKSFGKDARGMKPQDAHDTFPRSFIPRILKFMIWGLLTAKNRPSPFFEKSTPVVTPQLLSR